MSTGTPTSSSSPAQNTGVPSVLPALGFGSYKQQLASHVTQSLSRVGPHVLLSNSNYHTWSSEVRNGLSSLFYEEYLTTDKEEPTVDTRTLETNTVIRRCLVAWLLRQMDPQNRLLFEPTITEYTSTGPSTLDLPARLWQAVDSHYASCTEETKMILNKALSDVKQGPSEPILDHIGKFQNALNLFRLASGHIDEDELGRKLLMSINNDSFDDARDIANRGIIKYQDVLSELRRRVMTDEMLGIKAKKSTVVEANAVSRKKAKCTAKRCVGVKHSASECFRKPGNEHLMQEWVAERQKLGLW